MDLEQVQQMIKWINQQIVYLNGSIAEAEQTNNYGRRIQHEGMRDGFSKCLEQLTKIQRKKTITKPVQNDI
jgi:hypothetical protein